MKGHGKRKGKQHKQTAKAPEMKQLVEQLRPRTVMLGPTPTPPFDTQLKQKSLPIPLSLDDDRPSSSGASPNSYP